MSTISASTTTTTAFKVTSDTTGTLVLQTGSTPTTAVTLGSAGNVTIAAPSSGSALVMSAASGTAQQEILRATNSTNAGYLSITGVGSASAVASWANGSMVTEAIPFSSGNYILSAYTGNLLFQTNNRTTAMTLDTSGNLGIGTSSPAYNLEVSKSQDGVTNAAVTNANAGTAAQTRLRLNNGGSNFGTISHTGASFTTSGVFRADGTYVYGNGTGGLTLVTGATQPIYFGIANNEVARFDTSGNLGIGTSSPSQKLDVVGTVKVTSSSALSQYWNSASGAYTSWQYNGTTNGDIGTGNNAFSGGATGDFGITSRAGNLVFGTSSAERMRVTSIGRIGIATTSPSDTVGIGGTGGIQFEGWNNDRMFLLQTFSSGYFQRIAGDAATRQLRLESNSSDGGGSGSIVFKTSGSGTLATTMTLDGLGTLGVGITPNSWGGGSKAIQLPGGAISGYSGASNNQLILWNNCYYYTNFTYTNTDYANYFRIYNGDYAWFNAPSGTAGTTPTFTQVMTLDKNGNLLVGTTSTYNSAKVSVNGDVEARGNIKTRYGAYGALANGASLTLMSFPNGSYGSQLDGVLVVEQRDDSGGNLTTSTYLVSAYGGSGANFTAVSTQTYAGGQSFTIGSTTSSGNLVISITNTSGRACTSVNYTFLALKGGSTITYAF